MKELNVKKHKSGPLQSGEKLWNMRVTIILNPFGTLGTMSKFLKKRFEEQEISGRIETTTVQKSAKKIRRFMET